MSLRSDLRQQLIADDDAYGAVVRGLEVWALKVFGTRLRERGADRNRYLNGIGTFCQKVADQRLVEMKRVGGAQEVVADWILLVSKWAAGKTVMTPDVARALNEIYWTVFQLDSRVNGAGVRGPGVHRAAVRGD